MNGKEALARLKAAGTAQNRKVYARHGVDGTCYGVSYAELGKLAKTIKKDHDLARELWQSGIHDARVLATMIADASRTKATELESWSKDIGNYVLADAFAKHVAAVPRAGTLQERWRRSRDEYRAAAGWNVLSILAGKEDGPLDDPDFEQALETMRRTSTRAQTASATP